jgi:hypothetical protein
MGVRFDKLSPESQNALGTILAGKTGKENSNAARLSAATARPLVPAAPLEPSEVRRVPVPPTPASMKAADDGTADPWQSDKTEIAQSPPNFAVDGKRTSEELSLSGAEPVDFGAARGRPPAARRCCRAGRRSSSRPRRRRLAGQRDPRRRRQRQHAVRRNSPAAAWAPRRSCRRPRRAPLAGPDRPRSLSRGAGRAADRRPRSGTRCRVPSGAVAPVGAAGEDVSTDPFNRESAAAAGVAPVHRAGARCWW